MRDDKVIWDLVTRWFGTWWWASCHWWSRSTPTSAQALSCESKEGKKDSEVEVISLVCGPNTYLPFISGIFSFISSLQILARKVSRTHAWQWLPCPVTQRSPENEPHLIVHYPELFTTHLLCPQHTWKRGEDRCLFSVTTCAKVKFKHICGDHALVENVLPCCGMWKMNESGYWRMHSLPLILAA